MKDYFSYIGDYIHNRLNEADTRSFKAELQLNKELKQLVENYNSISEISEALLEIKLLEEVKKVSGQTTKTKYGYKELTVILLVAIIIITLIVLSIKLL